MTGIPAGPPLRRGSHRRGIFEKQGTVSDAKIALRTTASQQSHRQEMAPSARVISCPYFRKANASAAAFVRNFRFEVPLGPKA